jgi:hypothetical protein
MGPIPHNDVVTVTVHVACSDTLISVMKPWVTQWWPTEFGAYSTRILFKSLLVGCQTRILFESVNLSEALKPWTWIFERPQYDLWEYMSANWKSMFVE